MRLSLIAFLGLLSACSGLKTYPTAAGGNLAVRTQMDGNVRAALHIHTVDAQCRTEYRGSVQLDRPSLVLDLPAGRPSYVVVTFDTSSFLGGSRSTSAGTLLEPRSGSRYELSVSYRESLYDVVLSQSDSKGGQRRALPRRELEACRTRS